MAALWIHENPAHHRLTAEQHPKPHRIPVGEGEFDGPGLITQHKLLTNHVAGLGHAAGVADAAPFEHLSFVTHHHGSIALDRVHFKTDPIDPLELERNDVEGMQRGGRCP